MDTSNIEYLTGRWKEATSTVLQFNTLNIPALQDLFYKTFELLDKYQENDLAPRQIGALLIEMVDFSWWVTTLPDTPIYEHYQGIISLVYRINTYFLTGKDNTSEIKAIIEQL